MSNLDLARPDVLADLRAAGYTPTTLDQAVEDLATMIGVNTGDARLMLTGSSDVELVDG